MSRRLTYIQRRGTRAPPYSKTTNPRIGGIEPHPASYFSPRRGAGARPYFVYGKRLQQSIREIEPHPASYFSSRRGAGAQPYFVYGKRLQQSIGGKEPPEEGSERAMADNSKHYRRSSTYGSLAYDLDALARERQLDDAGRLPERKQRPAQPEIQTAQRRRPAAQAAVRPSPVVVLGTLVIVGMVIALMLCYVKLTGISDNVSSIKREISALEEQHIALLTEYERTFDLAAVKAAAEAAGMSKPSSGQIQYIDLSGADSVEVYAAGGAAALNGFTARVEDIWAYILEYFR